MHKQGELVLITVPFTDLTSQKRRPVIIVSNDAYNRVSPDVVVVAMTSNPARVAHSFLITAADLAEGALNRPGTVRVDKIYTLAQSLIAKRFAVVTPQVVARIGAMLNVLVAAKA